MNKATTTLFFTLGLLAGIMGIEHGLGEVLQGNRPTGGVFIESWPGAPFFEIITGEPAMTLIPNYLLTGLLAIGLSVAFLVVLIKFGRQGKRLWLLFALLAALLLAGGGFGPPVLGILAVLIGLKINSPLNGWRRLPAKLHHALSALWPWAYAVCLAGWLMLFPGTPLVAYFTGSQDALLMIIPIAVAFLMIPITLLLGYSRDVLQRKAA